MQGQRYPLVPKIDKTVKTLSIPELGVCQTQFPPGNVAYRTPKSERMVEKANSKINGYQEWKAEREKPAKNWV